MKLFPSFFVFTDYKARWNLIWESAAPPQPLSPTVNIANAEVESFSVKRDNKAEKQTIAGAGLQTGQYTVETIPKNTYIHAHTLSMRPWKKTSIKKLWDCTLIKELTLPTCKFLLMLQAKWFHSIRLFCRTRVRG